MRIEFAKDQLGEQVLVSTSRAARILNVAPETVRSWERSGRLRAIKTMDGTRVFLLADVEALRRQRAADIHRDDRAEQDSDDRDRPAITRRDTDDHARNRDSRHDARRAGGTRKGRPIAGG